MNSRMTDVIKDKYGVKRYVRAQVQACTDVVVHEYVKLCLRRLTSHVISSCACMSTCVSTCNHIGRHCQDYALPCLDTYMYVKIHLFLCITLLLHSFHREVKKDFDNLVNPETAQNLRAKNMEEELRKTRKRNTLLSEGMNENL